MKRIAEALRAWDGAAGILAEPLCALVRDTSYSRESAMAIESIARDVDVHWSVRKLAALMLESALVRIDDADERRFWLRRFGMFDFDLWRRLARFDRIHRLLLVARTNDCALRDYLHASERECRLTLARALFAVDEVIDRIERGLRRSQGIAGRATNDDVILETQHVLDGLPEMERAIVRHLARDGVIRWTSPAVSGELDALVAQPIGTVVLVIRPPGSTHEIEIKRCGRPSALPLDVIWSRDGDLLPSSHHLDAGSRHGCTLFEAESAAFLSRVFRAVHGFDAEMSRTLHVARIDTVPTTNGDVDLQTYFTSATVFGDRFYEMRWNLYHVVRTLKEYAGGPFLSGDDAFLTRELISLVRPAQAILVGTSALRLDRVERYLRPNGADHYFREGLGRDHDADDARHFADELLDDILGIYEPPDVSWRSHAQYVRAAFRVPHNRTHADDVYVSLHEQTGRFWGTLLAIRGHTEGESFVERNVGLRSVWTDGQWQVRIVFMDHDSMHCGLLDRNRFSPRPAVTHSAVDSMHLLGGFHPNRDYLRGALNCLRTIYRVDRVTMRRGIDAFQTAVKSAYDATHHAIRTDPAVAALFPREMVKTLKDWDEVVRGFLATSNAATRKAWGNATRATLSARGYEEATIDEHIEVVQQEARFLRRVAYLF
jgi:hypothetical protein